MGKEIRTKNGSTIREGIKQRLSKLVDKITTVNRNGDNMNDKGWKAIAIVGIWASVAIMFAVTGQLDKDIVTAAGTASVLVALFL